MGKVLIVDDEPDILRLNRYILEGQGYTVIEAGNGKEAMQRYSTNPDSFDLVVLDLTMPVMDGLDTFKQMRDVNPNLKILFITGYDDMWDLDSLENQPGIKILVKPYQIDDFVDIVKELVD